MDRAQLRQIGDRLIPPQAGKKVLIKVGPTQDIITQVIAEYKASKGQTAALAKWLWVPGNIMQSLYNVWHFWKFGTRYKIDPPSPQWLTDPATGKPVYDIVQWVQQPRALWHRGQGDCKSLSIAVLSTLRDMGIQGAFRFTNYNPLLNYPTHVYVVVMVNGKEIPVDCVWHQFGTEKEYNNKWDYNMAAIYSLSGLDDTGMDGIAGRKKVRFGLRALVPGLTVKRALQARRRKRAILGWEDNNITDDVASLMLDKQRLQMEQLINGEIHGIGTHQDDAYEVEILAHENAIRALMGMPEMAIQGLAGEYDAEDIAGVDDDGIAGGKKKTARKQKREEKKLKKAIKKNDGKGVSKKQAKRLQKAGIAVKKRRDNLIKRVGKGIVKVITTPARLALRTQIPKNAPFFLYLYITDPRILAKMPEIVAQKRAKAMAFKKVLVDKLQMREDVFDKAVRNGIMNAFGKSPENVLAQWIADSGFKIGLIPVIAKAGTMLKDLLGKLGAGVKEKIEMYTPAPEDWGTVENKDLVATEVQQQPTNNDPATNNQTVPARDYSTDNSFDSSNNKELPEVTVTNDKSLPDDGAPPANDPPKGGLPNAAAWGIGLGLGLMVLAGGGVFDTKPGKKK